MIARLGPDAVLRSAIALGGIASSVLLTMAFRL